MHVARLNIRLDIRYFRTISNTRRRTGRMTSGGKVEVVIERKPLNFGERLSVSSAFSLHLDLP